MTFRLAIYRKKIKRKKNTIISKQKVDSLTNHFFLPKYLNYKEQTFLNETFEVISFSSLLEVPVQIKLHLTFPLCKHMVLCLSIIIHMHWYAMEIFVEKGSLMIIVC